MPEVLFDVDGVLVHPLRFQAYLAQEHGIGPEHTRGFFRGPFLRCLVGEADLHRELEPFLPDWGWPGTTASFVQAWLEQEDAPIHEVLDFADGLARRGIRCHVASSQERNRAAFLREEMGFGRRFRHLLFSCELGAAKPDPRFFARAERVLGSAGRDLILLDDAPANVEAAREAGWRAVHHTGPDAVEALVWELDGP